MVQPQHAAALHEPRPENDLLTSDMTSSSTVLEPHSQRRAHICSAYSRPLMITVPRWRDECVASSMKPTKPGLFPDLCVAVVARVARVADMEGSDEAPPKADGL